MCHEGASSRRAPSSFSCCFLSGCPLGRMSTWGDVVSPTCFGNVHDGGKRGDDESRLKRERSMKKEGVGPRMARSGAQRLRNGIVRGHVLTGDARGFVVIFLDVVQYALVDRVLRASGEASLDDARSSDFEEDVARVRV